tara:strand:+ start:2710 stop:2892 length:183 start_codon:yes stop_codon:yes gene_type:complete
MPIKKVQPKKEVKEFEFELGKTYEVEATGDSIYMPKGKKYTLDGLQAKLLSKKGAVIYKG